MFRSIFAFKILALLWASALYPSNPCLPVFAMLSKYVTEDVERGVTYYSLAQQAERTLTLKEGRYVDQVGVPASHKGFKMFVVAGDGSLVTEYRLDPTTHHSTLAAGGPQAMAGWLKMDGGLPRLVTNGSGHYQPSLQQLQNLVEFWRRGGVNLDHLEIGFRVAITSSFADTFYYVLSVSEFEALMKQGPTSAQEALHLITESSMSFSRRAKAVAHLFMVDGKVSSSHRQLLRDAVNQNDQEVIDDLFDLVPSDHFGQLLEALRGLDNPVIHRLEEAFSEIQIERR